MDKDEHILKVLQHGIYKKMTNIFKGFEIANKKKQCLYFIPTPLRFPFLMSSIAEPQEVPQQILPLFAWDAIPTNS